MKGKYLFKIEQKTPYSKVCIDCIDEAKMARLLRIPISCATAEQRQAIITELYSPKHKKYKTKPSERAILGRVSLMSFFLG